MRRLFATNDTNFSLVTWRSWHLNVRYFSKLTNFTNKEFLFDFLVTVQLN